MDSPSFNDTNYKVKSNGSTPTLGQTTKPNEAQRWGQSVQTPAELARMGMNNASSRGYNTNFVQSGSGATMDKATWGLANQMMGNQPQGGQFVTFGEQQQPSPQELLMAGYQGMNANAQGRHARNYANALGALNQADAAALLGQQQLAEQQYNNDITNKLTARGQDMTLMGNKYSADARTYASQFNPYMQYGLGNSNETAS